MSSSSSIKFVFFCHFSNISRNFLKFLKFLGKKNRIQTIFLSFSNLEDAIPILKNVVIKKSLIIFKNLWLSKYFECVKKMERNFILGLVKKIFVKRHSV